jgi:hypothetical protein
MFLSEWREFPLAPCLAGKKKLMTTCVLLLKSHASSGVLPFSLCNLAHEQTPLSNNTIDSVLQHRKLGQAKDLSAPRCTVLPNFVFHMAGMCCPARMFGVVKITIANDDQVVQSNEMPYLPKFKTRILS